MMVQVKKNEHGLFKHKAYEVFAICNILKENEEVVEGTYYYIFNDTYNTIDYHGKNNLNILESSLDEDFITIEDEKKISFVIPKSINAGPFYYALIDIESVPLTSEIYHRFKNVIPEKIYAESFSHEYQDKNFNDIAEPIGDEWVLCAGCNNPFEVDEKVGVIKCPKCYTRQNNPYARKL